MEEEKEGLFQDHEVPAMQEPEPQSLKMDVYNISNPFHSVINIDELDDDKEYILNLNSRRVYFDNRVQHDTSGFYFYKINQFNEIIEVYSRICHPDEYGSLEEFPDFEEFIKNIKNDELISFIKTHIMQTNQEDLPLNKRYNCLVSCEISNNVAKQKPIDDSIYLSGFKNNILKELPEDKKQNIIHTWFDFDFQIFISARFDINFNIIAYEYIFLSDKRNFIKDLRKLKNNYLTEKNVQDVEYNFNENLNLFKKEAIQYKIRFNVIKNVIDRIYIKSVDNDFFDETIEGFENLKD